MVTQQTLDWVFSRTGTQSLDGCTLLQNLWGGYGELWRLGLRGGSVDSVILKVVIPPEAAKSSVSDRRKRVSYEVERAWYQQGSRLCSDDSRVAGCYGVEAPFLLLEDLGTAGFHPGRPPNIRAGLSWLAHFHARFLGLSLPGLWGQGSYWHLETRQEEWQRMPAGPLKESAAAVDRYLRQARYQTLLHGDSKPANFCWNASGQAAAVDFQYVGPGCGIRDVAYFLDCCLSYTGSENKVESWLDYYFEILEQALRRYGHQADGLEAEWRALFPVAWTDYARFMQGWGRPSALSAFSQKQLKRALRTIY